MRTIYAEYNINHDSIDVYTSAGYSFALIAGKLKKSKNHITDQNVRLLHWLWMSLWNMQDYILMETCLMYRLVKVSISEPFIVP